MGMTDPRASRGNDDVPDYELASDEANRRVDTLVQAIATQVRAGEVERTEAVEALSDALREMAAADPDVTDITVRDAIVRELDPVLVAAGWQRLEPFEF
jgi:cbb3-type cytochrome oxidase cytochrome c subunit